MILYGRDKEVAEWVRQQLNADSFDPCHALGVIQNNNLVAGVVYTEYRGNDVRLHVASTTPKWATRQHISELLDYAFTVLEVERVTGIIPVSNEKAIRFDKGIGFNQEGYHPKAGTDNEDCVSLGMLKEDFFKGKYKPIYKTMNSNDLVSPHAAWDQERIESLVSSMKNGWQGHPIVVLATDRNYALTGSHRIEAARRLNLPIPVHFVKDYLLSDDLFVELLTRAGDIKSAKLMQIEWDKFNGKTIST